MQVFAVVLRSVPCWAAVCGVAASLACSSTEVPNVTVGELAKLRIEAAAPLLLDVRTRGEFEAGHIPGAVHIPHTDLAARMTDLQVPEAGVVVYCQKGPRARQGEQILLDHGVTGVAHLEDGFSAWQAAGLPIDKGAAP